jgi:hypothetical protein
MHIGSMDLLMYFFSNLANPSPKMWYPRVNAINRVETAENRLKMHFASNIQKLERIPKFYNVYKFFMAVARSKVYKGR